MHAFGCIANPLSPLSGWCSLVYFFFNFHMYSSVLLLLLYIYIIESTDSISRDELDVPLTQYITNA